MVYTPIIVILIGPFVDVPGVSLQCMYYNLSASQLILHVVLSQHPGASHPHHRPSDHPPSPLRKFFL
jgi:hypothetical protein